MAVKGRLIPVPNLDDRDWRAIKDEIVRAIPERTPEWTDHNLSDPGITLAEAFALEIEQLIVRLNQVLPKHMREYLNMIGVTLTPPSAARTFCFFQTTTRPSFDITVLKGFEVSTSGAGGEKPVVFSSDQDLVIHAARLKKFVAEQGGTLTDFTGDARDADTVFSPLPAVRAGEAIYLACDENNYFEKLIVEVAAPASGVAGVWEFFEMRPDGTGSWEALVDAVDDGTLDVDQVLGRVSCSNAVRVAEEILGASDGSPDQRFFLSKVPILDLRLVVDEGAGFQDWAEMDDFSDSGPEDHHYRINRGTGEVLFGDGRHGKVPAKGAGNVRVRPYRFGGGIKGNVGADTLIQLRQTHPFIASVTNKEAASGGGNEETISEAMGRGPAEVLRTRNRAVVAEDFETLTLESSTGIARAKTLPLFDPADPGTPKAGLVSVIVLPKGGAPLSLALRNQVRKYLDARRLVTTRIFVVETEFVPVDLNLAVVKTPEANPVELEATLLRVVREYYDPEFGGDPARAVDYVAGVATQRGGGWTFGRDVFRSEIFQLLERIDGVDHVEGIAVPAATVPIEDFQLPQVRNLVVSVAARG